MSKCGRFHPDFEVPCTLVDDAHQQCGTWAKFAANGVQKFISWRKKDSRDPEKFWDDKAREILDAAINANIPVWRIAKLNGWELVGADVTINRRKVFHFKAPDGHYLDHAHAIS
jgi:hypothetical protein